MIPNDKNNIFSKNNIIIGQFNDSFPPIMDGVGLVTKNYALHLQQKGHTTVVVTAKYPKHKDKEKFDVLRFFSIPIINRPPYRYGVPSIDLYFKYKLNRIKFDIIHAHSPFKAGNIGLKYAKKHNIPFVASFHTKYHEDFKKVTSNKKIIEYYIKKIVKFYESADEVWIPNKKTEDTLREYGYKKEVIVMPNGTDIEVPNNTEVYKEKSEKILNIDKDTFLMIFIGQLIWEKNHKLTLKVLNYLKNKSNFKFKMIFIGQGYAESKMKKMVENFNLKEKVKFLGVIKDREKLKYFLARANLFVFPSLYDTSPLTLKESAAFQVPAILIKNSTASENIKDEYNGFLANNDIEDFAKKIIKIIKNPDLREKVGQKAYETLYITWDQVIDMVFERYLSLIKKSREKKFRKISV